MARTMQNPRKCTGGMAPRIGLASNPNGTVVEIPEIDDETAAKLKEIEEGEMRAEVKHIDRKYTEQGQTYYAETIEEEIPEQVNWWSKFALCIVRQLDPTNKHVQKISLQINSKHLKDILKSTIDSYPGVSFQTKDITVDQPYHVLFHYRRELEAAGKDQDEGSDGAEHLKLLLNFIHEEFAETIEESDNLREQGLMSYQHLWTIFRPGPQTIIYAPVFGQSRAFVLQNYQYVCGECPGLLLTVQFVDFDGEDLGTRSTTRLVFAFGGTAQIGNLSAFPIEFHPTPDTVKAGLIQRGRRWEQLADIHFCGYRGVALAHTRCGLSRYNVDGRVVIDAKTYHRLNADEAFTVSSFKSTEEKASKRRKIQDSSYDEEDEGETMDLIPDDNKLDLNPMTDEQCMLANAIVRGFSFTEKTWFDFFVDKLGKPNWNPKAFDQLVLPPAQKDLVRALVATHVQQRLGFDDIVKGKGKGLIMVLHGPPGVGKTLTAETVAEFCERPLYMVSSGDLGTDSSTLDDRLSKILDMASTWKAVLLIDEADVFLERRSLHDMERNSLVSIFLRVLEYYEGILFLTSNRVSTFDDAFKSRIHVPLKYNDLTLDSRKRIWRNFIGKMDDADVRVDEEGYEQLAQAEINGRQIKNVIRTAKSLAQYHGEKLDVAKLEQVIKIQEEFEAELDLTSEMQNGDGGRMINGH